MSLRFIGVVLSLGFCPTEIQLGIVDLAPVLPTRTHCEQPGRRVRIRPALLKTSLPTTLRPKRGSLENTQNDVYPCNLSEVGTLATSDSTRYVATSRPIRTSEFRHVACLGTPTCEQNVKNPTSWPFRVTVARGGRGADGGDADLSRNLRAGSIRGGSGARIR